MDDKFQKIDPRIVDAASTKNSNVACPKCATLARQAPAMYGSPKAAAKGGSWIEKNYSCPNPQCRHSWTEKQKLIQ